MDVQKSDITENDQACNHSKNENPFLAQNVIGLGEKLLIVISSRCSVCSKIATTFTEVPVGGSQIATVKPRF